MKIITRDKLFYGGLLIVFIVSLAIVGTSCQKKISSFTYAENEETSYRDIYPDTWVANDALGRSMPEYEEVGPVKNDQRRVVGIFYITWHTQDHLNKKQPYGGDVTKILEENTNARFEADNPLWSESVYHWGEPENGYFLSQDEYVIRKDISMLSDAGVDVLVMDVTNAVRYWDEWEVTFSTMEKMKAEGNKVPKFIFWAFNGTVITVVQDLYDRIYKEEKYKDLWFFWEGKPLLLYNNRPTVDANGGIAKHPNPHYDPAAPTDKNNPHYGNPDYANEFYTDYTKEVKEFFTLRTMWWGYYEWFGERFVGTEDNWSFGYSMANDEVKSLKPEELVSTHKGTKEEFAVTPAQHPVSMNPNINMGVGKSWSKEFGEPILNQYDMPDSAYVSWLDKTVKNPVEYGIYFQERWNEALEADPQFIYLNDWNEWTAGKYHPEGEGTFQWLGRDNSFRFIDQYNSEFNRTISPMKDGYTDNYYMQMAQNIRRYKGVRPIPEQNGFTSIKIDGIFNDWNKIKNEFRDTQNDIFHRDALGYASIHYINNSGRNDIVTSKVAVDKKNISFYVEASDNLTNSSDKNWMLLLIDADKNPETGWYGYDYIINNKIKGNHVTTLMRYDNNGWIEVADVEFFYTNNKMELSVPLDMLGLTAKQFVIDFKWSDNPTELKDPISFCTEGDTAPNRRFNYRFIWTR